MVRGPEGLALPAPLEPADAECHDPQFVVTEVRSMLSVPLTMVRVSLSVLTLPSRFVVFYTRTIVVVSPLTVVVSVSMLVLPSEFL